MFTRLISRFKSPAPVAPPKPPIFTTYEAFQAALRGHSQVRSCFAWGQYFPYVGKHIVDCVLQAEAYASEDCTGSALFTLVQPIYEGVAWPLRKDLSNNLETIVNELNTTFHREPATH